MADSLSSNIPRYLLHITALSRLYSEPPELFDNLYKLYYNCYGFLLCRENPHDLLAIDKAFVWYQLIKSGSIYHDPSKYK